MNGKTRFWGATCVSPPSHLLKSDAEVGHGLSKAEEGKIYRCKEPALWCESRGRCRFRLRCTILSDKLVADPNSEICLSAWIPWERRCETLPVAPVETSSLSRSIGRVFKSGEDCRSRRRQAVPPGLALSPVLYRRVRCARHVALPPAAGTKVFLHQHFKVGMNFFVDVCFHTAGRKEIAQETSGFHKERRVGRL